ncbi:MAG: glycosyltransferase [Candidatus Absconditabacterales bacterium]|jgi:glycosyltransferase involved in cell wall biosynthesis
MMFRVLKSHKFKDSRGAPFQKEPGDLVEVCVRKTANELLTSGVIGSANESHVITRDVTNVAKPFAKTLRVGVWIKTSHHYSGGRIHLYQYAWTLANMGAEVYLITDRRPKWADDYPLLDNLQIIIEGKKNIPADIDIIMTDSKDGLGKRALQWSRNNPQIKFICLNFETANWATSIFPPLGKRMQPVENVYKFADYLIANSDESKKWLHEAMIAVGAGDIEIGVFPPATNNFSMEKVEICGWNPPARPYAFYAARGCDYKKANVAIAAMNALKMPFDLVMMGQPAPNMPSSPDHTIHCLQGASDAIKYKALANATVTFAPSLFEGYGMVPGESLCAGTPVIAYDLPVLRQVYGNNIVYAKHNNVKDFVAKVRKFVPKFIDQKPKIAKKKMINDYGMKRLETYMDNLKFHTFTKTKITAQLITYYGFVPESILSVVPYIDELTVAFGRVQLAPHIEDGSKERLEKTLAKLPKHIKIHYKDQDLWDSKTDMRRWCTDKMSGNHLLLLDGDEIWTDIEAVLNDPSGFPAPRWVNFWHDAKHWVYDARQGESRWGVNDPNYTGSVCRH